MNGTCADLALSVGFLDYFQVVPLGQGPRSRGPRLRGPGLVWTVPGVFPSGVSRAGATDSNWMIRDWWCLCSSDIFQEILGVGPVGVSRARILLYKTILLRYNDYWKSNVLTRWVRLGGGPAGAAVEQSMCREWYRLGGWEQTYLRRVRGTCVLLELHRDRARCLRASCSEVCLHLCFNITMKGQTIEPDWYNRNLQYTRKYIKTMFFPMKIELKSDLVFSSCGF